MKFALVNEQRHETEPNLSGLCTACGHPMVAKCGEVRIWHWAHEQGRACDNWWENETEWHRSWKGQFPFDWQEIVHRADTGELHIADVKTDQGWVLEFQHSYIDPEERRSREAFYPKLLWVVDGARRIRDKQQFLRALERGWAVGANSRVRRVPFDECTILREWAGARTPVFFDFGAGEPVLWWLLHTASNGLTQVVPMLRADFVNIHRGGGTNATSEFDGLMTLRGKLAEAYEMQIREGSGRGIQQVFRRRGQVRRRL
jgi:competence protein CoiA